MLERSVAAARQIGEGVFWVGEPNAEALFRHLRRLNAARMPDGSIVYFRHYDSDVLAAIIPLLDAQQAANFFGTSCLVAMLGGKADGATVERPANLPEQTSGPIPFYPWQIEVLNERQRSLSVEKTARILRDEYPEQTSILNGPELRQKILSYEAEAKNMNLRSPKALLDWTRLNFQTNDGASRNGALRENIARLPGTHADSFLAGAMPNLIKGYLHAKESAD